MILLYKDKQVKRKKERMQGQMHILIFPRIHHLQLMRPKLTLQSCAQLSGKLRANGLFYSPLSPLMMTYTPVTGIKRKGSLHHKIQKFNYLFIFLTFPSPRSPRAASLPTRSSLQSISSPSSSLTSLPAFSFMGEGEERENFLSFFTEAWWCFLSRLELRRCLGLRSSSLSSDDESVDQEE